MASIAEVSQKFNISPYTLRFYEKEGLVEVPRNSSGIRDYDEYSQRIIGSIMHYRRAGISLAQIKEIFNTLHDDDYHLQILRERKAVLECEIVEMQQTLAFLNYKIASHSGENPRKMTLEEWLNVQVDEIGS